MSTSSSIPVLVSICIPAYKNAHYLTRLLDSIAAQTFRDFEVIVTDDSPDEQVKNLCNQYRLKLPLKFFKNPLNLNTPENWNEAIRHARGKWIKLMHDDDWFSSPDSLQQFADAIAAQPGCGFFFSAYANVYEDGRSTQQMHLKPFWEKALRTNANVLIADNVIGPPSVTLHKNDGTFWYDGRMKYIVDIDFYIRYLENQKFCYVPTPLVHVGINNAQVTKYTFGVAEVHLKEALLLLSKTGSQQLKNIIVFDGWWRLLRNFKVKGVGQLRASGYDGAVPGVILKMIDFQKRFPAAALRSGVTSKFLMTLCYAFLRSRKLIS